MAIRRRTGTRAVAERPVDARCGRKVYGKGAHGGCERKAYVEGVHGRCGRKAYVKGVHLRCGRKVYAEGVHVRCRRKVSTDGVHGRRGWVSGLAPHSPNRLLARRREPAGGKITVFGSLGSSVLSGRKISWIYEASLGSLGLKPHAVLENAPTASRFLFIFLYFTLLHAFVTTTQ